MKWVRKVRGMLYDGFLTIAVFSHSSWTSIITVEPEELAYDDTTSITTFSVKGFGKIRVRVTARIPCLFIQENQDYDLLEIALRSQKGQPKYFFRRSIVFIVPSTQHSFRLEYKWAFDNPIFILLDTAHKAYTQRLDFWNDPNLEQDVLDKIEQLFPGKLRVSQNVS